MNLNLSNLPRALTNHMSSYLQAEEIGKLKSANRKMNTDASYHGNDLKMANYFKLLTKIKTAATDLEQQINALENRSHLLIGKVVSFVCSSITYGKIHVIPVLEKLFVIIHRINLYLFPCYREEAKIQEQFKKDIQTKKLAIKSLTETKKYEETQAYFLDREKNKVSKIIRQQVEEKGHDWHNFSDEQEALLKANKYLLANEYHYKGCHAGRRFSVRLGPGISFNSCSSTLLSVEA